MGRDYIPTRDADALVWMQNFAYQAMRQWAAYAMTPADAESIEQAVRDYADAYELAIRPGSRTTAVVAAKDEARNLAIELCRAYAMQIKQNRGIANADKLLIGVLPVNPRRARVPGPTTSPVLNLKGATPGQCHTLTFQDGGIEAPRRAKPFGVIGLQLFVHVAEGLGPAKVSEARYLQTCTKNPVGIQHAAKDIGKVATYFGRWCTRRGEVGPWSESVRMHISI